MPERGNLDKQTVYVEGKPLKMPTVEELYPFAERPRLTFKGTIGIAALLLLLPFAVFAILAHLR
jgi:hypothetical protein